jgi:MFS family permease
VFVSEHVPARHIGYACGTLTAGLTAGILLGSLVATGINAVFDPQELLSHGWRVPFVLGGVFGVGSMYLRRWLHETPVSPNCSNARRWPPKCRSRPWCATTAAPL